MGSRGFSKEITSDGGTTYYLPRGEYNITTADSRQVVLDAAKQAVAATGVSAEILVTESIGRTWFGLSEKE